MSSKQPSSLQYNNSLKAIIQKKLRQDQINNYNEFDKNTSYERKTHKKIRFNDVVEEIPNDD